MCVVRRQDAVVPGLIIRVTESRRGGATAAVSFVMIAKVTILAEIMVNIVYIYCSKILLCLLTVLKSASTSLQLRFYRTGSQNKPGSREILHSQSRCNHVVS